MARVGERPALFADRVGEWYVSRRTAVLRKAHGLYLTPVAVADFMARRLAVSGRHPRLLDPAAGAGVLCCAAVEALVRRNPQPASIELVAYEVDPGLAELLRVVLRHLADWAQARGVSVTASVEASDFVAICGHVLRANGTLSLRDDGIPGATFDAVIANPPYFKLGRKDPRALALSEMVHGQPNIYALFMAVGGAMLRRGGSLAFITPRSFTSGPYFRKFRTTFFQMIRPQQVHVFGSRKEAFRRDDVLQESVIFFGEREDGWPPGKPAEKLAISHSGGVVDIEHAHVRTVPVRTTLDMQSTDKVLKLPASEADEAALAIVESWPSSLAALGLQISTGPVVAFRAADRIDASGDVPATHAPLLWMSHVRPMRATWPLNGAKPEFIRRTAVGTILVPNKNYVLLRRFSAKEEARRLTAAPHFARDCPGTAVGFENHLNYIHRPGGDLAEDEAWGLAALYSTRLLDTYFRVINGNTQVSATELRRLPLPARAAIVALGRHAKASPDPLGALDERAMRLIAAEPMPSPPVPHGRHRMGRHVRVQEQADGRLSAFQRPYRLGRHEIEGSPAAMP